MDSRKANQPLHYGLDVWKDSMRLAREIYRASARIPDDERFGLTAQMRRSAVSVPSNIAEEQVAEAARSTRTTYGLLVGL